MRRSLPSECARLRCLTAVLTLGAGLSIPTAAATQQLTRLAEACASGVSELTNQCLELALAAQSAQGLLGLAASGGTELPGSSSTLGRRFGSTPRFGLSLRGGFAHASMPGSLATPSGAAPDEGALAWAVQATTVVGLSNGFALAPTVGGILSIDLLGTVSWISPPGARGFQHSLNAGGLGIRLGVVRESFTLPGITLSAVRRWIGDARLGRSDVDGGQAAFSGTATSLRATVGKELLGLGVLGGFGWDRYQSDVDLEAVGFDENEGLVGTTTAEPLRTTRLLFFGGVGYTFLIAQFSAEGGYAEGFEEVAGRTSGYDPASGAIFLRVAFRLTL